MDSYICVLLKSRNKIEVQVLKFVSRRLRGPCWKYEILLIMMRKLKTNFLYFQQMESVPCALQERFKIKGCVVALNFSKPSSSLRVLSISSLLTKSKGLYALNE